MEQLILEKAQTWLGEGFDDETRKAVKDMIDNNPQELVESFYQDLEFGTGGLRGIMGVGTNRMNKYTVGMATQGLANYLKKIFPDKNPVRVAIAYDSRNNSPYFAKITAEVFSANNIRVYLFHSLRPTPELSFAIRHLNCQSGIVITASHNPKEYNGYKAYWEDGSQLIPPHDKNVIAEVQKITSVSDVRFEGIPENIEMIGEEIDKVYLEKVKSLSLSPAAIQEHKDLKIVYTPLHGTGGEMVPAALKKFGFENISVVAAQAITDGNFPTVKSPNPEEPAALEMAIAQAEKIGADIVMATDPDADRVGIAVRDLQGRFTLLNGNQTAALLTYYLLLKWKENKKLKGNEFIVKTIVTSELIKEIADAFGVECFDVLTGFKWIAEIIRLNEGNKTFIGGGEESYGYMTGDFVRDKDAVSSCALVAETAAWAATRGKSLYELLIDIYLEFGLFRESLISVTKKGKSGSEEIRKMMDIFRNTPPQIINGSKVILIKDYKSSEAHDLLTGEKSKINLPASNVLQFFMEDGSKISVRPSGTEPKIKFYFGVMNELNSRSDFEKINDILDQRIRNIINDLKLV
ncbi:MAG TPA: phospho-sugar mutase [Bacteroidales bacterium]|nr:phospho-sugar mutase [Bacteroidales bacterium]HOX78025.1 phospho-sugar mutase [Bacteroidales bacterium]HPI84960.1 phospho-sugar mutase [Bacteroidales bacterium]